ncbi:6-phospho-3-hexuloisomerase [Paenibacillus sp. PK4536]|uniref:6-phospho-3-hexuloisomerase n=1 Tax=Paenibacillus sp. PK4536 TaxID=3024576 RepID=UPI0023595BEF|nr:6-phospho-3-hexuloisomerase [Paenibacillus sp. PK4536]WIM38910.1 6-phospho-3-hexuloisomerase [Paenibacillus sp. PK4536]
MSNQAGISKHFDRIIQELERTLAAIPEVEAEALVQQILSARQVFVAGAGRSGLMAKALAMRLMQLGLKAYVVGETVTPRSGKGDLLIIASGSGETQGLVLMAEKAQQAEVTIAAVTIFPESTIGQKSALTVKLPGSPKDPADHNQYETVQPMGSLFEQTVLLFFDGLMLRLMEHRGGDSAAMFTNHANLE